MRRPGPRVKTLFTAMVSLALWAQAALAAQQQPTQDPDQQDQQDQQPDAPIFRFGPTPAEVWQSWRDERTDRLTNGSVTPLTISDRLVLRAGRQVGLATAPQRAGNWVFSDQSAGAISIEFSPERRLLVKAAGRDRRLDVGEGVNLGEDLHVRWTYALPYRDRALVFLHDRDHLGRRSFAALARWFDYDPAYRITGRFVAQESSRATYIENKAGVTIIVYRIGLWETRWNDQPVSLSVYSETRALTDATKLWILFTDDSNGDDTADAGRYVDYLLYADITDDLGLAVDFNYATAPFCELSQLLDCPVINRSHIPLPVLAGERKPRGKIPTERPRLPPNQRPQTLNPLNPQR